MTTTHKKPTPTTLLILATNNPNKTKEITAILPPHIHPIPIQKIQNIPPPPETAPTLQANAALKARHIAQHLKPNKTTNQHQTTYILADDTGLHVHALNNAPGIHSARFTNPNNPHQNTPDHANNTKLLNLLTNTPQPQRTAHFHCALALLTYQPPNHHQIHYFHGQCHGHITQTPRGKNGFGYDPLFIPNGHTQTLSQLTPQQKNQISHRAQALKKLTQHLTHQHPTNQP